MMEFDIRNIKEFALEIYRRIDGEKLPVFLCVGSDKFVADCLGPIVAEILINKYNVPAYVYGGLTYNINAENLGYVSNYIQCQHPHSQLILIDATLSEKVGEIIVTNGSFAGLGKILPIKKLGDFSILGVVGKKGKEFMLGATKLQLVKDMATYIAKGISMALYTKKSFVNKNRHLSTDNCIKIQ